MTLTIDLKITEKNGAKSETKPLVAEMWATSEILSLLPGAHEYQLSSTMTFDLNVTEKMAPNVKLSPGVNEIRAT